MTWNEILQSGKTGGDLGLLVIDWIIENARDKAAFEKAMKYAQALHAIGEAASASGLDLNIHLGNGHTVPDNTPFFSLKYEFDLGIGRHWRAMVFVRTDETRDEYCDVRGMGDF